MVKTLYSKETMRASIESKSVPEPNTGCWLWLGGISVPGYGCVYNGKTIVSSHRASYWAFKGEINDGLFVLHKCDQKTCVNPEHLFLGTQKDNMRDCVSKNRLRPGRKPGESNSQAKLTENDVIEIRSGKYVNMSVRKVASELGVSSGAIQCVRTRKSWRHVQ